MPYTVQGVRELLVRNGCSCQVPVRRALGRDDEAVSGWVKEVWPCADEDQVRNTEAPPRLFGRKGGASVSGFDDSRLDLNAGWLS
ncbi:winged helix-turn-helix domain-containing protein [Streptomyces sp. NBC_01594]